MRCVIVVGTLALGIAACGNPAPTKGVNHENSFVWVEAIHSQNPEDVSAAFWAISRNPMPAVWDNGSRNNTQIGVPQGNEYTGQDLREQLLLSQNADSTGRSSGELRGIYAFRSIICRYDWPCSEAIRVVYGPTPPNQQAPLGCDNGESGGDERAGEGWSDNIGLFQINLIHGFTVAQLVDPVFNTQVAYDLWRDQGWQPWSCRP